MPLEQLIYSGTAWEAFRGGDGSAVPASPPADPFVFRTTMPDYTNTGVPSGTTLTTFDPGNTQRLLIISTAGTTYENVNFGNVKIAVRAANVTFRKCRWNITDADITGTTAIISAINAAVTSLRIEQCDIINADNNGYLLTGIQGHHFTAYRNKILGCMDGIAPSGGAGWKIHGNFIAEMGWFADDVGGNVHTSDVQSHADCIQVMTGAADGEIIGNHLEGHPSTTIGTGTPNSGSDTGWPESWYTQAQGEARRAQLLLGRTPLGKSWDGLVHEVSNGLTPLMINRSPVKVEDNWIGGGGIAVNARDTNLVSPLGSFYRNKFWADMMNSTAGRPLGLSIRTNLTADIPSSGANRNTWIDDGTTVARVNW